MTNFIYEGHINHALCDKIIDYHKNSPNKTEGYVLNGNFSNSVVNKNVKDSTDVIFNFDDELYTEYVTELQRVVTDYITRYPSCNFYSPFGIQESVNIQHYMPGGGYKVWHTERTQQFLGNIQRSSTQPKLVHQNATG